MSNKIEFLEKHCSTSKEGMVALSNSLVERAVKLHNCPIKVTCTDYPGQEILLSVEELRKPEFTAGPYEDQYRDGATYSLYMYKWKGETAKEVETEELVESPIIEKRGKTYFIKTAVVVTTFEEKEISLHDYVGMTIYKARKAKKLSQNQLSVLTNGRVSGSNIGQIESSATNPILSSLEAIAEALDMHITDLFPPK
jgi:hypothetical protein